MDFFDQTKSLVDNLSSLSSVIIALFSIVGVIQIIQAKRALIINSKREAASMAAQQVKDYGERIIPILTKYDAILRNNKIESHFNQGQEFTEEVANNKFGKDFVKSEMIKRIPCALEMCDALNALEGFAIYFIKGVADEQIAYSSIGRTFCFSIEQYYLEIAANRSENDPAFQNTIELYKIWKPRLEKDKLAREQIKIMEKMKNLKTNSINPIGTK